MIDEVCAIQTRWRAVLSVKAAVWVHVRMTAVIANVPPDVLDRPPPTAL